MHRCMNGWMPEALICKCLLTAVALVSVVAAVVLPVTDPRRGDAGAIATAEGGRVAGHRGDSCVTERERVWRLWSF